jgi:hypothetical protein
LNSVLRKLEHERRMRGLIEYDRKKEKNTAEKEFRW